MNDFRSFSHLMRRAAGEHGQRTAFTFLADADGVPPETLSYAELDHRAGAIGAFLQERGLSGERVLLLYPSSLRFIEAFLGCMYAGAIAVPAPLPAGQPHHIDRLAAIARDADVGIVLTVDAAAPLARPLLDRAGLQDVGLDVTDEAPLADACAWTAPGLGPDTLAFLQYTSGSTGAPRGVMVSHGNLLHNQTIIRRTFGTVGGERSGGWLPFYHDMGLIGQVLGSLWNGGSAVLMSPTGFLRRPHRWLEMIGDYGITHSGGPNFAYELCLRRVSDTELELLDLSSWEVAYTGAEPVRAATLNAFAKRFAAAGFRPEALHPCYGLAEATLCVTGARRGRGPVVAAVSVRALEAGAVIEPRDGERAVELVSSGIGGELDVRTVDPDSRRETAPGHVGEIWVRGASLAQGYWRDPAATARTFGAVTAAGDEGFLRTGDLGAFLDGELFVCGRSKELIIVNGRNLYPHDIEEEVRAAHPALAVAAAAAFGVEGDEEHVVAVIELDEGVLRGERSVDVAGAIKLRLAQRLGLRPGAIVLVPRRAVLRTTSGKIQRRQMRSAFLAHDLPALYEDIDPAVAVLRSRDL